MNIRCKLFYLLLWACAVPSQQVSAQHTVLSYIELGSATPVREFNYGWAIEGDFSLSKQVTLAAGLRLANRYPSTLGDLKAGVIVYPVRHSRSWVIENEIVFSNFAPWPMSQLYYRLTAGWQCRWFRVDLGNAFAMYVGSGVVKYHLWRPSFNLRGTFRSDEKRWNASVFVRNFNRFEAHGAKAVEWGGELSMRLGERWRIFCEPFVTTVGNFNGTAEFYNFNCHFGGAFQW